MSAREGNGHRLLRTIEVLGESLITLGVVMLLFVVYEVYWTDVVSAGRQRDVTSALDREWAGAPAADDPTVGGQRRTTKSSVPDGQGFAKLSVPRFGSDYHFTVLEGTSTAALEAGPGHYTGTAFPGEPGNFSVAGHRVGKGAPFNDLDQLNSCDAIILETDTSWSVYRVLPMASEVVGWSTGRGTAPACSASTTAVTPPGGVYSGVAGREIVNPSDGAVIAPVPGKAGATVDPKDQLALLTLTTCDPQFSAEHRMIIHATLVRSMPKSGSAVPPEMQEH
ncbi:MAG: class E sortase [Mycobacteriaceae bacterium]